MTTLLAVQALRGVLAGEWLVTDYFESAHRRLLIAQRCRPGDVRALGARERQVLALVLQGHSNKFVALELGLAPSTVATHLRRAMIKLHVDSREALIQSLSVDALAPPDDGVAPGARVDDTPCLGAASTSSK